MSGLFPSPQNGVSDEIVAKVVTIRNRDIHWRNTSMVSNMTVLQNVQPVPFFDPEEGTVFGLACGMHCFRFSLWKCRTT